MPLIVVGGFADVVALLGRVPRVRVGDVELDSQLVTQVHNTGVDAALAKVAVALEEDKDPAEVLAAGKEAAWGDPYEGWSTDDRWLRQFKSHQPGSVYSMQHGPDGTLWGVLYDSVTGHPKKVRRLPHLPRVPGEDVRPFVPDPEYPPPPGVG